MMCKRLISLIIAAVLIAASFAVVPASAQTFAGIYLAHMTTEDKISMMIMPAFRTYKDAGGNSVNVTQITDDIEGSIKKHTYAGVILFGQNTPTNENTVRLTDALQKANAAGGADRPQLLITIDQEGGSVTRLNQGTMTPGNMSLGAINDTDVTGKVASIIASELRAVGVNADFAPVVDVNSNPANPIIGVRSFSDDPQTVAQHGSVFVETLNNAGIISTLKHFPGHGDTDTDSHTGLPCINKTYEELKQNELIPFQACIDAGSQMIMTAHIQYPLIETGTYISKKDGKKVFLPATLSKTIITDILRGDMGYDGVVITDAMEMDAIAQHFDKYDAAKLAINAGVDILLIPVDTTTKQGFAEIDTYISTLAAMADNGEIPMEKINAAVLRILNLKEKNGMFTSYDGSDIENRVEYAVNNVGTKETHDREWEITKKAITLVRNEDNTLPLTKPNQKTVVLVPYNDETIPMDYAVRKLTADGKLPEGATVEAYSYYKKGTDDMLPKIEGADNVVFMSEIYGAYALKNATAQMADTLADTVHENGGKFIVMSVSLPYDAARFQKADAIMIAYLPRSMPVDPGDKVREMQQYGPNMPVALYMMFSAQDAPTAKLPINIPQLDENYSFTDTVLYARGFGLTYEQPQKQRLLGDANCDGEVDITDVTAIQRKLAFVPVPMFDDRAADVDGDGDVTVVDVTAVQHYLVGLSCPEGIGEPIGEQPSSDIEHKLVKSVTAYQRDFSTGEWKLSKTTNISYENNYPVVIEVVEHYGDDEEDGISHTNFDYTFENGLPKTCIITKDYEAGQTRIEYNNGRVYDIMTTTVTQGEYIHTIYQYSNDDGFFTSLLRESYSPAFGVNSEQFMEETDSVQVVTENGLLKKTVNSGYYANWGGETAKTWLRFMGTYTADYYSDGIASEFNAAFRDGRTQFQDKYVVVKENGRITEALHQIPDGNGGFTDMDRVVFEYTDTGIDAARYSQMMNYFIVGPGSNYYNNNWY